MPAIFELITAPKDLKDLVPPDAPYYVAAKQGIYIHKKGPLGTALLPMKTMPPTLNAFPTDSEKGLFTYSAKEIPAQIMADALAFFRDTYTKHKAEAELILLLNTTTEEYQLFCPYQRVSGASVHSLYDPTTLPTHFQAIGTLHSHCHMTAFHSGTDTTDASTFPGLHITIGTIDKPTYAVMVMFNDVRFDYQIEQIASLAEATAAYPPIWHERVVTASEQERAKVLADTIANVSKTDIDRFLQRGTPSPKPSQQWFGNHPHLGSTDHFGMFGGENYEIWDNESNKWTGKTKHKKRTKHSPEPMHRWSSELRTNLPADLLDRLGEFKDVDSAIEGIAMLLDRIKGAAGNYDLGFGYELSDQMSGQTIIWSLPDDEEEELVPTTTGEP